MILVPAGSDNTFQINENKRVIAINIPNDQSVADKPWRAYLTSVDALETLTGYDFMSNLSVEVQRIIKMRIDGGNS